MGLPRDHPPHIHAAASQRKLARSGRAILPKRGKYGSLRCDEGLGLLRLGDVCAAVFTIVDAFAELVGFGWDGVDGLS